MLAHARALGHVCTLKCNSPLADTILELPASTANLRVLLTQEQLLRWWKNSSFTAATSIPCSSSKVTNMPQLVKDFAKYLEGVRNVFSSRCFDQHPQQSKQNNFVPGPLKYRETWSWQLPQVFHWLDSHNTSLETNINQLFNLEGLVYAPVMAQMQCTIFLCNRPCSHSLQPHLHIMSNSSS